MDDLKPWHIVLIIAAVAVLGFSVYRAVFSNSVPKHDSILLVDVTTGILYDAHKGDARGMLLPARSPDTNERTLFPVEQTEDGQWRVRARYTGVLDGMDLKNSRVKGGYIVDIDSEDAVYYEPVLPGG